MNHKTAQNQFDQGGNSIKVEFYGGVFGALLPFLIFVVGVISIALSGAPDEKGFWPILLLALGIGLLISKDKTAYSEAVINGMSDRIVMIMITAWILASIIGVLLTITGFVEALTWIASLLNLGSISFVLATFVICCVVSLSTGSSFATILICAPILYPVGGLLGSHVITLAGAIIAGATFGDFTAPISDTTISSALSQDAEIGPTVRSRMKYIIPASTMAFIAFGFSAYIFRNGMTNDPSPISGSPEGLPMLLVPALIIWLFLRKKHLLHGLLLGLLFGTALGVGLGLLPLQKILTLDLDNFSAQSFVIEGINGVVGLSFFTILLMGLVGTIRESGLMTQLLNYAEKRSRTQGQGELWMSGLVGAAVVLTTHSIVSILAVADFVKSSGKRLNIRPIRRANILSLVVCIFPFVLPYCIPVILMSGMTATGEEFGIPSVSPLKVGLFNFLSWVLLLVTIAVVGLGYGRNKDNEI